MPWLRSGDATRNSYQTGGALERLLALHGPLALALSAWTFLALAAAAVVALFAIGRVRSAAVLAAVLALLSGVVAIAALRAHGTTTIAVANLGPQVTLLGAILVLIAATLGVVPADRGSDGQDRRKELDA